MEVELRIRDSARGDQLRAYVERRLAFALSRFGSRIARIVVRIDRLKGVPGTNDTSFPIEARLMPLGTVAVKEKGTDQFARIDRATGRGTFSRLARARESKSGRIYRDQGVSRPRMEGTNERGNSGAASQGCGYSREQGLQSLLDSCK